MVILAGANTMVGGIIAERGRCRDEPARRTGSSRRKRRPVRQTAREAGKETCHRQFVENEALTEMI